MPSRHRPAQMIPTILLSAALSFDPHRYLPAIRDTAFLQSPSLTETFINLHMLVMSLESYTMYTSKYPSTHYAEDTRSWPPIPGPWNYCSYTPSRGYQHIHQMDELIANTQTNYPPQPNDLVSTVFGQQAAEHAVNSTHVANLIQERREMAKKHLDDIKFRLDDLIRDRSILRMLNSPESDRRLINMDRQLFDLERQQREIQTRLWKDTLDLEDRLLEERSEYQATRRRSEFLSGGAYAA